MKDINQSQEVVKTETSVGYEQQQEKKDKFIGSILPGDGHTIWKMDVRSLYVQEVDPVEDYTHSIGWDQLPNRRILVKEGYLYCSALNKKNAIKRFGKMLQTIYGSNTIPEAESKEETN